MRALLLVGLLALLAASSVAIEQRVFLESSVHSDVPEGWRRLGKASPESPLVLTVALKQQNLDQLAAFVAQVSNPQSPSYGRYMTVPEVHAMVAPLPEATRAVQSWLDAHSVSYTVLPTHFIEVKLAVAEAEKLLQTTFHTFRHQGTGKTLTRALAGYSVPASIAEHIDLIGGVIRFPQLPTRSVLAKRSSSASQEAPITPQAIRDLYNITIPNPPAKNLQAVVSFLGQYYSPDDLSAFQQQFNLPSLPIEKTLGENDASNPGVEASLDVQYLTGIANSVRTWVYYTPGERTGGNEPFMVWLSHLGDTTELPWVFSISYQDLEYTVTPKFADRVNAEFMKYSSTGRTFVTGSGDWGVGCKDKDHCDVFTSDFPSCSPYITSLGATKVTSSAEVGIGFSSGGFSNYFAQPDYQTKAVSLFLNQPNKPSTKYYNVSGRAFPDISCVGHDFQVIVGGNMRPVDGTSASTPTWAAQVSLLNSLRLAKGLPTMGLVNPFIYALQNSAFKDITSGDQQDSGCCKASFSTVPGWDPYTGLGTPNWSVLAAKAMDSSFFNFPKAK